MRYILSAPDIKVKYYLLMLILIVLYSCRTTSALVEIRPEDDLSDTQEKIVEGANWALGRKTLNVNGRTFNVDCSGTVMAIYYYAGIDLGKDFSKYTGGGTSRIYQYLDDKELLYDTKLPVPGDIIFWDNTFDANGDGKRNDYLTHMGIVVEVSEWGTVTYIHENYRKGIIFESMNLLSPEDLKTNSAMRMKGTGMKGGWLASHLYRESAMGYKLEKEQE
ncbi:MAG: CHAP domain-containing protein [Spirochaetaceae bacterium]|nr:CHAP domain-containing protein [Spirochaetaceae bacterium]